MLEIYTAACLAVATEAPCCSYAIYLQRKMLVDGIKHAEKSLSSGSPLVKSFHRLKALEKFQKVAMQDIYPKGRKYALRLLYFLQEECVAK